MILKGTIWDLNQLDDTMLAVTLTFRGKAKRYGRVMRKGRQEYVNIVLFGNLAERAMEGTDNLSKGDKVKFDVELGGRLTKTGHVFNNLKADGYEILEHASTSIFDREKVTA